MITMTRVGCHQLCWRDILYVLEEKARGSGVFTLSLLSRPVCSALSVIGERCPTHNYGDVL